MPTPKSINIAMPPALQSFVRERVETGGFGNVSEYFRHLVREDQRRAARRGLERALLEGLNSGKPVEATDEYWRRKRSSATAPARAPGTRRPRRSAA